MTTVYKIFEFIMAKHFFMFQVKNSIWNGMDKDEIEQQNITAWRRKYRAGR